MENKIPKRNPARDSNISNDMELAEMLTILSILSKNLAKKILLQKAGNNGGMSYGNRNPYQKSRTF